jgi:hypothetical protein
MTGIGNIPSFTPRVSALHPSVVKWVAVAVAVAGEGAGVVAVVEVVVAAVEVEGEKTP